MSTYCNLTYVDSKQSYAQTILTEHLLKQSLLQARPTVKQRAVREIDTLVGVKGVAMGTFENQVAFRPKLLVAAKTT